MSISLRILLIVFCLFWLFILLTFLKKGKIPFKYSVVWFGVIFILLFLTIFPNIILGITKLLGFETASNMIIGVILTLLLVITLVLTMIVSKQKTIINKLVQEVSLLQKEK